jgi:hypothetical protein
MQIAEFLGNGVCVIGLEIGVAAGISFTSVQSKTAFYSLEIYKKKNLQHSGVRQMPLKTLLSK